MYKLGASVAGSVDALAVGAGAYPCSVTVDLMVGEGAADAEVGRPAACGRLGCSHGLIVMIAPTAAATIAPPAPIRAMRTWNPWSPSGCLPPVAPFPVDIRIPFRLISYVSW